MTQNTFSTPNSAALASNIEKFEIASNYNKTLDVSVGTVQVQYFESILDYTVRVSATIIDTGYRSNGPGANVFEEEDLKLTGGEKVHLIFADNFDQKLDFSNLRIKKIRDIVEHTQQVVYTLDLWSQECEDNELVKCRVTKRYDGKVSDSVRKILTEVLKTKKVVDVDTTANEFPFLGRLEKPFYKCTWLAKRCIPQLNGTKGKTAGYFFFETADGYKFKSIDNLWSQTPKRRLIYTNTPSLPNEYDAKILEYYFDNTIDVEQSMSTGAMFKSELQATNFYDNKPRRSELSHEQQQNSSSMGGLEHPKLGADRNLQNEATRITVKFDKKGVLPPGKTLKTQLEKSKENDYNIDEITRQAYMRYNQLFTYKLSITIPGDFGLRAGDIVHCDFPEISSKNMKLVSQKKSGLYMIVDLSHLITTNKTFTKLNLVRDSIGRKPF